METYHIFTCPECGSTRSRDLECEEHGRDCPLIVCCECGAEVHNKNPEPKEADMNITKNAWTVKRDGVGTYHLTTDTGNRLAVLLPESAEGGARYEEIAKLIAQAPGLLAACKDALAYLERHPFKNTAGTEVEPAICFALRQIIKAVE